VCLSGTREEGLRIGVLFFVFYFQPTGTDKLRLITLKRPFATLFFPKSHDVGRVRRFAPHNNCGYFFSFQKNPKNHKRTFTRFYDVKVHRTL